MSNKFLVGKKQFISLQLHPKQAEVYHNNSRFRVVVAGRRFGKTTLAVNEMLKYANKPSSVIWYVAPTYRMAKQIVWNTLKDIVPKEWIVKTRENELSIELRNKTRIELRGADKPDSLRGVSLDFLVLDEFQDIAEETWTQVLRPTLADRKGKALFIGTPKGFSYFYKIYKLGQEKIRQERLQWHSWQFPTITSPFISIAEIETARSDMDEKSFRQEFCHLPETQIKLLSGKNVAIKDLEVGDKILCSIPSRDLITHCSVSDVRCTGKRTIHKVTLDNGEVFKASTGHKLTKTTFNFQIKKHESTKVELKEAKWIERYVSYMGLLKYYLTYCWKHKELVNPINWLKERFILSLPILHWSDVFGQFRHLVKFPIESREQTEKKTTYNITVDSPDHSYLLADGTNNYNCASFESMSGRVYYPFDRTEHIKPCPFNPKLPIWVGMDFNIDPMSTVIFQPQPNGELWAVDEVVQVASSTDDICSELERRYHRYQHAVTIYPDPAGGARQHARGETDLDIIREHGFKRIKVRRSHSLVSDRVNAVNRLLRSAKGDIRLYIDPKCKHLIESFEQTLYVPCSREVDKSLSVEHSADAAGYCIEIEFPIKKFTPKGFSR